MIKLKEKIKEMHEQGMSIENLFDYIDYLKDLFIINDYTYDDLYDYICDIEIENRVE